MPMTPEQKRIKIAECCPTVFRIIDGKTYWKNDDGLVDMLEDLNAMAQAEATLRDEEWYAYSDHLLDITPSEWSPHKSVIHALAEHRADAFLKVKGIL